MLKPRSPEKNEFNQVVEFLNCQLRSDQIQSSPISSEYPTALSLSNIHNMSIITDEEDQKILSHAVIKPLVTKTPFAAYKIAAIGSVVTDPDFRNQGLSTLNMQNCLAKATAQDCDLVILWTDQFNFYKKFGFELAGHENTYLFETPLPQRSKAVRFSKGNNVDPQALLNLYSQHTVGSIRTIEDIQKFLKIPNTHLYTAWSDSNQLLAYAVQGKGADLQSFIHEWGGHVDPLIDLLSAMVKLENKPFHIMVPEHAFNLKRALAELQLFCHEGFLAMIRIHDFDAISIKVKKAFRSQGFENFVLEKQHGQIIFGLGTDLYTIDQESELVKIIFGPAKIHDLTFIKPETRNVMAQVLPMPLWVWGWDSI